MGIARGQARLLLDEAAADPFSGRALQLGRQHLFFDRGEFEGWAQIHGVKLRCDLVNSNKREPLLGPQYIDDGSFFSLLGFDTVESCDYSSDEDPTYVLDLNVEIDSMLAGRYDTVFDIGTLEHVFHVPNVLKNIHTLLKVGGRIVHQLPSSNHVDHGFYMFSPTLFADYYLANNYEICSLNVFEYAIKFQSGDFHVYQYHPAVLHKMSMGGFTNGKLLGINIVARKTADSTSQVIPQQSMYADRWSDKTPSPDTKAGIAKLPTYMQGPGHSRDTSLLGRFKRHILRRGRRPLDHLKIKEY